MEYAQLAAFFDRIEATTKRLEMTGILVEMLQAADADEMSSIIRLLQGKVAPDWEGIELGMAEKMVLQVLARAAGLNIKAGGVDTATKVYHEEGDLGLAAQELLARGGPAQVGLMAFGAEEVEGPDVGEVFERLSTIAAATGSGSQEDKQQILWRLLTDVGPQEAKYIVRTVAGRLRLGVADMSLLDALAAWYLGRGARSVQDMSPEERAELESVRATLEKGYDLCSDLARVAQTLATDGLDAVARLQVEHGTPLRPMAAERLKTLPAILEKHGGRSAMEYKYDGLRLQCHVTKGSVRLFSRRMEDLTDQFPDVQEALQAALRVDSCIVEGEGVAWDPEAEKMRPFQDISRRRGRKTGLGEGARKENALSQGAAAGSTMLDEVPVKVFLFDCLAVDGVDTLSESYEERRKRLDGSFVATERVVTSTTEVATDVATMETFFVEAVQQGAEGIMCKDLDAPYKAGNRGFAWIKYKTDYTEDLVDSMDLVVIGAFYGRGRRAGWYGALLMAAYDPETGHYPSVCKLGTGFDDATLMGLKERFAELESPERPPDVESGMVPDVWLHPGIVMEVQAAELTLSPVHRCAWDRIRQGAGLAARFPRFSGRWRDDKGPQDATTPDELVNMYQPGQ